MTYSHHSRWLMALAAAALVNGSLLAQDTDFYVVNGEPVPIQRQMQIRALWKPAMEFDANATIEAEDLGLIKKAARLLDMPRTLDYYGIEVYQRRETATDAEFDRAIGLLKKSLGYTREAPVYAYGNINLLLTANFIVEFDEDQIGNVTDTVLKTQLTRYFKAEPKLRVVRDKKRPEQRRFKVYFPSLPLEKALALVNNLNGQSGIDSAYPGFVHFRDLKTWLDLLDKLTITTSGPPLRLCLPGITLPNDPEFHRQWALHHWGTGTPPTCQSNFPPGECGFDIDWLKARNSNLLVESPDELITAVLDLGVHEHRDLRLIIPGINATETGSWKPINDYNKHGTNVAGIAAAVIDNCGGMAGTVPSARILSVRISEVVSGSIWEEFHFEAAAGVRQAADEGARVLINSWWLNEAPNQDLVNQVEAAVTEHDAIVVIASGNIDLLTECNESNGKNACESAVKSPATLAADSNECLSGGVLAVSASTQEGKFKTVELYADPPPDGVSQAGSGRWGSRHGPEISVAAPGTDIFTTDAGNQYAKDFFGTSASAPFVGGAATAILARHPTASAYQVKDWIQRGADPGPGGMPTPNDYFGHGHLNIRAALELADAEMAMNPPPDPRPNCP